MTITGFVNSFTQGEISGDAWDRTDIQPINKGCEQALNFIIQIAGPLAKRRGFWDQGAVPTASAGRLVPFSRGLADALMLLFQDHVVWVYSADGAPLMNGGAQVSFASPYSAAQIPGLRWKQVADVIYFRHASGLAPQVLARISNTVWTWNVETFNNGPWRPENADKSSTLVFTGASELDVNPHVGGGGSILTGQAVTIAASKAVFDPGMVGSLMRIRAGDGTASAYSWTAGQNTITGWYVVSNGHVYVCVVEGPSPDYCTNPPVQLSGQQSDGDCLFEYRHDGSGVVQITGVSSPTAASATVISTIPVISGQTTSFWAEGAYSDYRGWPRAWPTLREERLVSAATATDLDFLDLTESAGFGPASESYRPGTGIGLVLATDAVRRRIGDDGGEILWTQISTFLVVGTNSGEYLVGGQVLDEPISPSTVVTKQLSAFGSEDVYPARMHEGIVFVTTGYTTLRELIVDTNQQPTGSDLTFLARHIGERKFVQLAWVRQPDEVLWARMADGGLAAMTYHREQQVRGWTRQALGDGSWFCEDIQVLPGPGRLMTLWAVLSRVKGGVTQRHIWMQSQESDQLFMDGAQLYQGAPASVIGGLGVYEGETIMALADGAQVSDLVVSGGQITLPAAASHVMAGQPYTANFRSLNLDVGPLQALLSTRQRVTGALVSLTTAEAYVGLDGTPLTQRVGKRYAQYDIPAAHARRLRESVVIAADTARENRITIYDYCAYDCRLYSIRPHVSGPS